AGCARSACARTPARRSDPAPARRSARHGRPRRSNRAAWRAAPAWSGRRTSAAYFDGTDDRLGRRPELMQLPGPVRAYVGLLATAADGAKRLPDRAIEFPMLAVSTALQMSLRAQQRYARLTAR